MDKKKALKVSLPKQKIFKVNVERKNSLCKTDKSGTNNRGGDLARL